MLKFTFLGVNNQLGYEVYLNSKQAERLRRTWNRLKNKVVQRSTIYFKDGTQLCIDKNRETVTFLLTTTSVKGIIVYNSVDFEKGLEQ